MMTCNDELVQLYVEGSLEPAAATIVAEHLRTCSSCRRTANAYKGLYWDLSHARELAPESPIDPSGLATRLQAEWQRGNESAASIAGHPALLWLTANPAVTTSADFAGKAGRATLSGLAQVSRVGLSALWRTAKDRRTRLKEGGRS